MRVMQRSQIEMNVLLVITNINGFHEVPYSFGLSSIASYIESKGYNPKILSISATDQFTTYIKEIKKFNPRVIGFSSVSSQFEYVMQLAELAKGISKEIVIVCGGVHPTLFPDDIRKTNDIDGFFIGTFDLSQSLGIPGQVNHPDVLKAVEDIVQRAGRKNIAVGIFAVNYEQVERYVKTGVRFIAYGTDTLIAQRACRDLCKDLKKVMG